MAAYKTRGDKMTPRDIQAGIRAAAGWSILDALTGNFNDDKDARKLDHNANLRRALLIG